MKETKLPMPRFVVFYNGQKKRPEQQVTNPGKNPTKQRIKAGIE